MALFFHRMGNTFLPGGLYPKCGCLGFGNLRFIDHGLSIRIVINTPLIAYASFLSPAMAAVYYSLITIEDLSKFGIPRPGELDTSFLSLPQPYNVKISGDGNMVVLVKGEKVYFWNLDE